MTSKDCETLAPELVAYVDGEQPETERARIEAHLDGCPACRREVERIAEIGAMITRLPRIEPSPELEGALWRRLEDDPPAHARGRWRRALLVGGPVLATAAGLALVWYSSLSPGARTRASAGRQVAAAPSPSPGSGAAVADAGEKGGIEPGLRLANPAPGDLPPELLEHPDLFLRFPVVRRLEKLEHFEDVRRYGEAEPVGELAPSERPLG